MTGETSEADRKRLMQRAVNALRRPGAYVCMGRAGYEVRTDADRRRRPALSLTRDLFHALARSPGMTARAGGGFRLNQGECDPDGRVGPSLLLGERVIADPQGRETRVRANAGESPVAWLARRRDADGAPYLTAIQVVAAERLRIDYLQCGVIGRLTADWSAGPPTGPTASALSPAERAIGAKRRVAAALAALGPAHAPIVERICLAGSALEAAERDLGLSRRSGKHHLSQALNRLAAHYRLTGPAEARAAP